MTVSLRFTISGALDEEPYYGKLPGKGVSQFQLTLFLFHPLTFHYSPRSSVTLEISF